jgi:hypothetical protein
MAPQWPARSFKICAVPLPTVGAKPARRDGIRKSTIGKELFGLRRNVENIDDTPLAEVDLRGPYSYSARSTAFMRLAWVGFLIAVPTANLSAQTIAPSFTRQGIGPEQLLMPNDLITIYGEHLAPSTGCRQTAPSARGIYATQMCGTQVTVDGIPAGLLAVLEKQRYALITDCVGFPLRLQSVAVHAPPRLGSSCVISISRYPPALSAAAVIFDAVPLPLADGV